MSYLHDYLQKATDHFLWTHLLLLLPQQFSKRPSQLSHLQTTYNLVNHAILSMPNKVKVDERIQHIIDHYRKTIYKSEAPAKR